MRVDLWSKIFCENFGNVMEKARTLGNDGQVA